MNFTSVNYIHIHEASYRSKTVIIMVSMKMMTVQQQQYGSACGASRKLRRT